MCLWCVVNGRAIRCVDLAPGTANVVAAILEVAAVIVLALATITEGTDVGAVLYRAATKC